MDAGGGRVVADIAGDAALGREGVEALGVGDLVDEAPLIEDVEEVGFVLGGHWLRPLFDRLVMRAVSRS